MPKDAAEEQSAHDAPSPGVGTASPRICCLDLDTFFVSVERIVDPSLRGRPVVVGGARGGRGVVTSASYEARAFGVRSGMSIREASERAPKDAVFVPGHHDLYSDYSRRAREIVERFSPIVIAASIDEHYIDFRGCERMYERPSDAGDGDATILRTVREITATIDRELGLPSSAGIATTKTMAKVASGLAKPAGVLLVRAGTEAATLAPLPVRKLPGIGPVAEGKLLALGLVTLAEVAAAPAALLKPIFGAYTAALQRAARGERRSGFDGAAAGTGTGDRAGAGVGAEAGAGPEAEELGRERPAFREHDPHGVCSGTISNERTFIESGPDVAHQILSSLSERVSSRARRRGVVASQVTLKLRYTDFQTISRARTIEPTNVDFVIHRVVLDLYHATRTRPLPIRLLGIQLAKFRLDTIQLPLFDGGERRGLAVDRVREKFGYDAVHLATTLGRHRGTRRR